MSWTFPADWEDALWSAATELLPPEAMEPRAIAAAIEERSAMYTTDRDRLRKRMPPRDLAARALFFTPSDAPKMGVCIAELARRGLLPAHRPLRILDAGAGVGAMTLGLAAALPGVPLVVRAVDRDGEALALFAAVVRRLRLAITLETVVADADAGSGPYDLVVAGTMLNELDRGRALPLVRGWMSRLAEDGACILVEPALRETSRPLHELRDALIAGGHAHVFAPCTRHGAPCPALADPRDWCHEDRGFEPSPRMAQLGQRVGLKRGRLKFSYLTLRRQPADLVVPEPGWVPLRVVSESLKAKGRTERFLCGDDGRERFRVLHRHRGPATRALDDADRGDVLLVRRGVTADELELRCVRPAEPEPEPAEPPPESPALPREDH